MLRKILGLNAAFSILNAALLILWPWQMAFFLFDSQFQLFGLPAAVVLQILAIGLFAFAFYVAFIGYKLPKYMWHIKIIIFADWTWVVLTALSLLFAKSIFTPIGLIFFAVVAVIVAGFAFMQTKYFKAQL